MLYTYYKEERLSSELGPINEHIYSRAVSLPLRENVKLQGTENKLSHKGHDSFLLDALIHVANNCQQYQPASKLAVNTFTVNNIEER